jgi:hypothetical protein
VNYAKEERQRMWKPVVPKNNILIADTTLEDRLREDLLIKIHGGFPPGSRVPCAVKLLCQSPKKPIYEKLTPTGPEFDPEFE